jgi:hypothetical protein
MSHPIKGNRRRDVALAVTLLAFATAAIAAAHWGAASHADESDALLLGDDDDRAIGTSGRSSDIQLGPAVSPLFTAAGPTSAPMPESSGDEVPLPEAIVAGGAASGHGFASYHSAGALAAPSYAFGSGAASRARRGSSGGSGGFGGSLGGMSMGGAWGGVSGTAQNTTRGPSAVSASVLTRATGGGPAAAAPPASRPSGRPDSGTGSAPAVAGVTGGDDGPAGVAGFTGGDDGPAALAGETVTGFVAGTEGAVPGDLAPAQGDPGSPGPAPTPEPLTLMLVGMGAAGLYGLRRHLV